MHVTATAEIYTLSLHDALPISKEVERTIFDSGPLLDSTRALHENSGNFSLQSNWSRRAFEEGVRQVKEHIAAGEDRKSTRLNSSHGYISYAVFCLKKKKTDKIK